MKKNVLSVKTKKKKKYDYFSIDKLNVPLIDDIKDLSLDKTAALMEVFKEFQEWFKPNESVISSFNEIKPDDIDALIKYIKALQELKADEVLAKFVFGYIKAVGVQTNIELIQRLDILDLIKIASLINQSIKLG